MKRTKNIALKLTFAFIAMATIISCNREPQSELSELVARRDSIRAVRENLEDEILRLDAIIQDLDTTLSYKMVTVLEADTSLFKHYFDVYGNVKSDNTASLFAENPGNITTIPVREGQPVKKGQVLVRIDDALFDRNLQELQTSLDLATILYNKQKRLWDQNIGSEVEFLEAKNRKESTENSIATLKEQRSKSNILAPFDGVVDKIFQNVGEMASGQQPVIRIVNLGDLYITSDVSERYINDLKVGDEVMMSFGNDSLVSGISRIGAFINPTNRSFEVQVDLNGKMEGIRPNSLVSLKINDLVKHGAIVLPSSIIMQDGKGQDYVFVIGKDDSNYPIAVKTVVTTGSSYGGKTVILEGVSRGEKVIDKGARSVRGTDRVNIATT